MELKKLKSRDEFEILQSKLQDLGLYEKGMDLEQMRQVMGVVDESINETSFSDRDIEIAIRESEREFSCANICNSTMIGLEQTNSPEDASYCGHHNRQLKSTSSPYSSPEISCVQKITVVAEIHHEMAWTPENGSPRQEQKMTVQQEKAKTDVRPQDDSGVILSSHSVFESTSF